MMRNIFRRQQRNQHEEKHTIAPAIYDELWNAWTQGSDQSRPFVGWESVLNAVKADQPYGHIVKYSDNSRDDMLLFHIICALDPPLQAIDAVFRAYPEAIRRKSRRAQLTPLMVACGRNASLSVVRYLCWADPQGLRQRDTNGYAAIHWACRENVSYSIVELLLLTDLSLASLHVETDWTRTTMFGTGGISPLEILYQNRYSVGVNGDWNQNQWKKVVHLLSARHYSCLVAEGECSFSTLHAALACQCPAFVVDTAMSHDIGFTAMVRDARGNLPLHYAVGSPSVSDWHIERLLGVYPEAARLRDQQGNLPLHQALKHGIYWDKGVSSLCALYPAACSIQDSETALYPVLLAAIFSDLSATFSLLKADPLICIHCKQ